MTLLVSVFHPSSYFQVSSAGPEVSQAGLGGGDIDIFQVVWISDGLLSESLLQGGKDCFLNTNIVQSFQLFKKA